MTMPRPQVIVSRFGVPIPGQNEAALEFTPRYTDIHWNGSIMSAIEYLKSLDIEPGERVHVIRASSRKELL